MRENQPLRPDIRSGPLGIVLIPDSKTIQKSYELAASALPKGAEYVLAEGSLPHITLYHGKIENCPIQTPRSLVASISSELRGRQVWLDRLVGFGGNFIFWNVDVEDPSAEVLFAAHRQALELANFLDRTAVPNSKEEGLQLTDAELENVKLYGHPLVRDLYTPHITLGFEPGVEAQARELPSERWKCTVESVRLVRIGYPGRVEEVLDETLSH